MQANCIKAQTTNQMIASNWKVTNSPTSQNTGQINLISYLLWDLIVINSCDFWIYKRCLIQVLLSSILLISEFLGLPLKATKQWIFSLLQCTETLSKEVCSWVQYCLYWSSFVWLPLVYFLLTQNTNLSQKPLSHFSVSWCLLSFCPAWSSPILVHPSL